MRSGGWVGHNGLGGGVGSFYERVYAEESKNEESYIEWTKNGQTLSWAGADWIRTYPYDTTGQI